MNTKTWHPKTTTGSSLRFVRKTFVGKNPHERRSERPVAPQNSHGFWANVHDELGSANSGGKSQSWESPKTSGLSTSLRMSQGHGEMWRCKGYYRNSFLYINPQVGLKGLQVFVEQVFSLKISLEHWVHVETEQKSWLMRRLVERGWLNDIFSPFVKVPSFPPTICTSEKKHWCILTPLEATYPQRLEVLGMPISNLFPCGVIYTSNNHGTVENGCSSKVIFFFFLSIFG